MIAFSNILTKFITTLLICHTLNDCIVFDFTTPESLQPNEWYSESDKVLGGRSSASIYSVDHEDSRFAVFSYNLVPLKTGACFVSVKVNSSLRTWNLSNFDGIELKVRRTGDNKCFKIIFDQIHSYEHQFQAPEIWDVVRLPFTGFLPYKCGKRIQTDRLLDTNVLDFGIQMFGGVFEKFKQSGSGTLEIEWVRAYNTEEA